ncbi:hypothetical protein WKI68_38225 [Streptomyces sp. MS1.HAVA.3]|uniref:Uncharacterized protein n=1 Tax=Streptomyces caledonius TaxID=3134107 RepID=A0ABU8UC93_9ACTN
MSRRAGVFVTRRPRLVLLAALAFLLLSVVFGAEATGRLKAEGYDDPRSESSRAAVIAAGGPGASPTWSSSRRPAAGPSTTRRPGAPARP